MHISKCVTVQMNKKGSITASIYNCIYASFFHTDATNQTLKMLNRDALIKILQSNGPITIPVAFFVAIVSEDLFTDVVIFPNK